MAAFAHQQATGQPITAEALASHLNIPPALPGHSCTTSAAPASRRPVTAVNGTRYPAGSRP